MTLAFSLSRHGDDGRVDAHDHPAGRRARAEARRQDPHGARANTVVGGERRLALDRGRLGRVEAWQPTTRLTGQEWEQPSTDERRAMAMFPGLTFLQLLFGFRGLAELEAAFPDCIVRTNEARALLTALFPKRLSDVWPVV